MNNIFNFLLNIIVKDEEFPHSKNPSWISIQQEIWRH